MALQKTIVHNVTLAGDIQLIAHIRIENLDGNKDKMNAKAVYRKDKADGQIIKHEWWSFVPSLSGDNFIAQAYDHLKTLPEFEGATDC